MRVPELHESSLSSHSFNQDDRHATVPLANYPEGTCDQQREEAGDEVRNRIRSHGEGLRLLVRKKSE